MSPTLPSDCLSDFVLDEVVGGAPVSDKVGGHLASCDRCRARLARLREIDSASCETVDLLVSRAMSVRPPRRTTPVWQVALAGTFAVACACALFMVSRSRPTDADGTRGKGDSIRFYRQRDGQVVRGVSGDRFRQGDALRFVASASEDSQLLLVGIESSGKVSAYFPFGGRSSAAITAPAEVTLPGSLVLDDSPNDEFFLAVFHSSPVAVADVERALSALRASPPFDLATLRRMSLPGRHHWIVIRRQP